MVKSPNLINPSFITSKPNFVLNENVWLASKICSKYSLLIYCKVTKKYTFELKTMYFWLLNGHNKFHGLGLGRYPPNTFMTLIIRIESFDRMWRREWKHSLDEFQMSLATFSTKNSFGILVKAKIINVRKRINDTLMLSPSSL